MMWTELVQYSVVALMLDIRKHVRFIDERVKNVKTDRAKSKDSHSSLLCSHSHFSLAVKYNRSCSVFLFIMRHGVSLRAARKGFSRDGEWLRRLL